MGEKRWEINASRQRIYCCILIIFFIFFLPSSFSLLPSARAADSALEEQRLPRYVSIKAKEINLRTGPGERYPIDWVLRGAKGWPLQVIGEHDNWRQVQDWSGTIGWVHQAMLSKKLAAVVTMNDAVLRRAPMENSQGRARVAQGTHGTVKKCEERWCFLEFEGASGWLPTSSLWGVDVGAKKEKE